MDARRFVSLPMKKWDTAYARLSQDARIRLDDEAAALATRYARLSRYVSRRLSGGKHEDAVKAQNVTARRVRQALGYTYKDDAIIF